MDIILSLPIAFAIYLLLAGGLSLLGRNMAGVSVADEAKQSAYTGGETLPPSQEVAPGYRPFFLVALFFAVLHLGVLVLASGTASTITALYLGGLIVILLVLTVGIRRH